MGYLKEKIPDLICRVIGYSFVEYFHFDICKTCRIIRIKDRK